MLREYCQSSQPIAHVKAKAQAIKVELTLVLIDDEGARHITKLANRPQEISAKGSSAKELNTKGANNPTIKPPAAPPMDKHR